MAEPTNTPMPPSTPITSLTPRSASPAPPVPAPSSASDSASASAPPPLTNGTSPRPVVLHIGDVVRFNPTTYAAFSAAFEVVRPSTPDRSRAEFIKALRDRRWGDFAAVFRPFWGTGGEMGRWDEELISLLPQSCRVFASAGAGFDWADTQALGERGIIYCNSGLAAAEAVADFAVAMVISTFRHLPWCIGAATPPPSTTTPPEATVLFQACHALATPASHNLRNHTLGLIGLGNIGQSLAAKLGHAAFGMRVAYFDVERKSPAAEAGATFCETLESLLAVSDCTVLCAPASPDGRALITAATLAHAKPGSRFVNIARGSLVDEDALADALDAGVLSAAALDVHAAEPRVHPRLVKLAGVGPVGAGAGAGGGVPGRVMLTCHNAGGTVETHVGFEELSMRNIMAVLGGGEAITPVNLQYLRKG